MLHAIIYPIVFSQQYLFSLSIIFIFLIPRSYSYFSSCTKMFLSTELNPCQVQDHVFYPFVLSHKSFFFFFFKSDMVSSLWPKIVKEMSQLSWRQSSFCISELLAAISLFFHPPQKWHRDLGCMDSFSPGHGRGVDALQHIWNTEPAPRSTTPKQRWWQCECSIIQGAYPLAPRKPSSWLLYPLNGCSVPHQPST